LGAKDFLKTLPGLVVSGGKTTAGGGGVNVKQVWRLEMATLRWEAMPALADIRDNHACCVVRGGLVVIGGQASDEGAVIGSVGRLAEGEGAFTSQPPLSWGGTAGAVALAVNENNSAVGQALLLGGYPNLGDILSTVSLVDLATGVCTPQPNLLHARCGVAAVRLPDGCVVCAGGYCFEGVELSSVEVWGPSTQGAVNVAWTWRELPAMRVARASCEDVC